MHTYLLAHLHACLMRISMLAYFYACLVPISTLAFFHAYFLICLRPHMPIPTPACFHSCLLHMLSNLLSAYCLENKLDAQRQYVVIGTLALLFV